MRLNHTVIGLGIFASTFVTTSAFAQDATPTPAPAAATPATTPASPTAAAPAVPVQEDKPKPPPTDEDEFKPIALSANPLSLILTRIGVNVEWLPVTHHALVLNPYFQS